MKKIIMAAAALTAGIVMADDSIVSSTVVGYQSKTLGAGNFVITPCFENTNEKTYPIDDLKVTGVPDQMANIQKMDASGNWTGMYFWFNEAEYDGKVVPSGWFDINGVEPANISLNSGEAVFFYSDQDGAGIQTSGNVTVGEIKQSVANGWSLIGNATPVAIEIDNLKVTGVPDQMANIQTMDASGNMTGMYYWFNEAEYDGQVVPSGWFDVNGVEPAGISLQPGESVFFSTDQDGVSVTIPAAL